MGRSQIGEHGDGGLNDVAQGSHLAFLTDARLEHADLRVTIEQPHRERYADLRIVTARTAGHHHPRREKLIEPLLDHRLTVAPGDAHHGDGEFVSMTFGQSLQSFPRGEHLEKVGLRVAFRGLLGHTFHHEVAHAAGIKLGDVAVTIVPGRPQCKKKRLFRETQRTTVCENKPHLGFATAKSMSPHQRGHSFNRIRHLCLDCSFLQR